MFCTTNSSPMLITKSVFKLIFVLSNYQTCLPFNPSLTASYSLHFCLHRFNSFPSIFCAYYFAYKSMQYFVGFPRIARRLWNSLPENLREIHNISSLYQQQLKTHLFTLAFPTTWEFSLFHFNLHLWMVFYQSTVHVYEWCVFIIIMYAIFREK